MDTPSPSTASTTAHAVGYNDEPSITAAPLRSTDDLAVDAGQLSSLILTTEATRSLYLMGNCLLALMLYPIRRGHGGGKTIPWYDFILMGLTRLP